MVYSSWAFRAHLSMCSMESVSAALLFRVFSQNQKHETKALVRVSAIKRQKEIERERKKREGEGEVLRREQERPWKDKRERKKREGRFKGAA